MGRKIIVAAIFSVAFFWAKTAASYATYRQDNVSPDEVLYNAELWLNESEPLQSSSAEIWMSAHPWLTLRLIQFFEQNYRITLTNEQKVQIIWGSIAEDIDLIGSGEGRYGDVSPFTPLGRLFSDQWDMHINRAENHFYNYAGDDSGGLTYGPRVDTAQNVSSWRWAEGSDLNHYDFWDGVAYGQTIDGWRALGQVLHLLEDASVPAHVRNDLHLVPDHYESHTNKPPATLTQFFSSQTIEPVRMIASLRNYFDFVANFSRSNFYSDDSFFQSNSCGYDFWPDAECVEVPLVTIGREEWYYFYNNLNRKIGYKGFLFHLMESVGKRAEALVLAVSVNEVVTTDIWQAVTPNVIAAGAGLMKYFFDQLPPVVECVDADGDGFGRDCPAGNDCDDSRPEINPQATELCDAIDNNCDYKIDETCPCQVGTRRNCGPDKGICRPGIQTCEASGWGECKGGVQPQLETCNGLDDDCDGEIDERLTQSCTTDCGSGAETCKQGDWVNCTAPQPKIEVCDGKDNNCDGWIDEGVKNACGGCGPVSNESCDNQDNNCNGVVDEDLSTLCFTACGSGTAVCRNGFWVNCTALKPSAEICDGKDNNCDGEADEGVKNRCDQCGPLPKEICNNQDDDCNGQIDENLSRPCQTACGKGKEFCVFGQWKNCNAPAPSDEVCDGLDNDCNGKIDEKCSCRVGAEQFCGLNIGICRQGVQECFSNGWGECVGEIKSQEEICNEVDDDCDGVADDGVHNICGQCGDVPEEACDNFDNNCNGEIDEALSRPCETICGQGTETCRQGKWENCSAPLPTEERCDGIDNDCDGIIDNGCECLTGARVACGSNIGACEEGEMECQQNGKWGECSGGITPSIEVCDGQDNDCNGMIDENFELGVECREGIGACERVGATICAQNGQQVVCNITAGNPEQEICDGIDNDCDGVIDQESTIGCAVYSKDIDRDGYGLINDKKCLCAAQNPYDAVQSNDCNDSDSLINPAAIEIYGDGIDNNCDGEVDEIVYGTKKWIFSMGGNAFSSPAIGGDGTIYVGSYDKKLYAINPDGTKKWEFLTGDSVTSSPAIGSDGTIYVGSWDKRLYAINPDGTKRWSFLMSDIVPSSPAIGSDGTIYVGSEDKNLYAINPDGTKKWAFLTSDWVPSSPAIGSDGTIYVGSYDAGLYAINPSGTKKWTFWTGNNIFSSPAIGSDGTIYVGSWDKYLNAINSDGTEKWRFWANNLVESSPAIGSDGTIYVGSEDKNLYAMNPDGTKKWAFLADCDIDSSPAIGNDGVIYFGACDGNLYAINPDGTKNWTFLTRGIPLYSSPAVGSDGIVYIGAYDSRLYAIFSSSYGPINSPWPKFRHDNRNTGNVNTPIE